MTSNQNISNNERQGVQAFTGGEAGLDVAANWVVTNDAGEHAAGEHDPERHDDRRGQQRLRGRRTKISTGQWTGDLDHDSPNGKATRVLQEQLQSNRCRDARRRSGATAS